jgi:hypothetical protein
MFRGGTPWAKGEGASPRSTACHHTFMVDTSLGKESAKVSGCLSSWNTNRVISNAKVVNNTSDRF